MGDRSAGEADSVLWTRTVEGDPDAFAELYRRHGKRIYNYLFRRVGDWSEAEDLTASVFLEAYRRRHEVAIPEEKVGAWFFGIATNLAHNRRRSLRSARRLLERLAGAVSARPGESDASARAEAREQMGAVLAAMSALPREQQDVVALCLWSGLSYEDAAVALSIPIGTVRSRLSRARAALAELEPGSRHGISQNQEVEELLR
jgi:RNA polymerase sigma factor (sigma-70 family)